MVRPRPPLARFSREPRVTRSTRVHSTASNCPPLPTAHRTAAHFCCPWVAAGGVNVILVRPKEIACGELREALEQYDRDPKATGQLCVVVCPQLEPLGQWTLDGPRWSKVLVPARGSSLALTP